MKGYSRIQGLGTLASGSEPFGSPDVRRAHESECGSGFLVPPKGHPIYTTDIHTLLHIGVQPLKLPGHLGTLKPIDPKPKPKIRSPQSYLNLRRTTMDNPKSRDPNSYTCGSGFLFCDALPTPLRAETENKIWV